MAASRVFTQRCLLRRWEGLRDSAEEGRRRSGRTGETKQKQETRGEGVYTGKRHGEKRKRSERGPPVAMGDTIFSGDITFLNEKIQVLFLMDLRTKRVPGYKLSCWVFTRTPFSNVNNLRPFDIERCY